MIRARNSARPPVRGGVLLLDKPAGMSSNAALQRVRAMFDRIKAGHTGTLDPLATGLLPICLCEATKFAGGLLEADKTYQAVLRFGAATDTGDSEGRVLFEGQTGDAAERLKAVLPDFVGDIDQTPPMYSAIKHRGKPLYEYARRGQHVDRGARGVKIYQIDLLWDRIPDVALRIRCSKGTYIRTLAHDIGARVGCGAHLIALRRTRVGDLAIDEAVTLDTLQPMDQTARWSLLRGPEILLSQFPAVVLPAADAKDALQGKLVTSPAQTASGTVRLYDASGLFLGVGLSKTDGTIAPRRMCSILAPGTDELGVA